MTTANETLFDEINNVSLCVIATDGHPDESQDTILGYACKMKGRGIRIVVIGIGSGIPEDFLRQLASSEDDYFFAKASVELKKIYRKISDGLTRM